jgi:hypothetical protein
MEGTSQLTPSAVAALALSGIPSGLLSTITVCAPGGTLLGVKLNASEGGVSVSAVGVTVRVIGTVTLLPLTLNVTDPRAAPTGCPVGSALMPIFVEYVVRPLLTVPGPMLPEAGTEIQAAEDVAAKEGELAPAEGVVKVRVTFPPVAAPPYGAERLSPEGEAPRVAMPAGFTTRVIDTLAVLPMLSVTWTVNGNEPGTVGLPAITPGLNKSPPGSVAGVVTHWNGGLPPRTANVASYGIPTVA